MLGHFSPDGRFFVPGYRRERFTFGRTRPPVTHPGAASDPVTIRRALVLSHCNLSPDWVEGGVQLFHPDHRAIPYLPKRRVQP